MPQAKSSTAALVRTVRAHAADRHPMLDRYCDHCGAQLAHLLARVADRREVDETSLPCDLSRNLVVRQACTHWYQSELRSGLGSLRSAGP